MVGHTIVGYIHPSKAPAINRNMGDPQRESYEPDTVEYTPAAPGETDNRPSSTDSGALTDARDEAAANQDT